MFVQPSQKQCFVIVVEQCTTSSGGIGNSDTGWLTRNAQKRPERNRKSRGSRGGRLKLLGKQTPREKGRPSVRIGERLADAGTEIRPNAVGRLVRVAPG
jgi:hypothetical protein